MDGDFGGVVQVGHCVRGGEADTGSMARGAVSAAWVGRGKGGTKVVPRRSETKSPPTTVVFETAMRTRILQLCNRQVVSAVGCVCVCLLAAVHRQ